MGTNGQAIVTRRVVERQPKFHWIHAIYSGGRICSIPTTVRAAIVLWEALLLGKTNTIYLVCSRSEGGFLRDLPALLPAIFGKRVIVHAHGSDIVDLLCRGRLSSVARWLYRRCELIVPSVHLVPLLEGVDIKNLYVCENFAQQNKETAIDPQPSQKPSLDLLWNSNVMSSKGFFDVAASVALARSNGHDVRFTSLGECLGDNEKTSTQVTAELERLIDQPWFTYLGRVTPECAVQQTAKADVVALPSRYKSECQPLALIQAMSFGKKIIIADTPALRATTRDYPAVILTDPSPTAIALVLAEMISEKEGVRKARDRKLNVASQNARERFSTTNFDESMRCILDNVHSN